MKSRNLSHEEKDKIRDRYQENVFFRLVTQSCKRYEREMRIFKFSPEDVFLESLCVLDDLKAPNRNRMDLCENLWDDLFCSFRDRGEDIPEEELEMAVGVVLSAVVCCLVLLDSVKYTPLVATLHATVFENFGECQEVQQKIDYHATKIGVAALSDWIRGYMRCDNYLSEEVEDCLDEKDGEGQNGGMASSFRIAEGHKQNFAKIVSAMYELRMFEDESGKIASNKRKLIMELGKFLGTDFSTVSQMLNAAKQSKSYTEIFDKLKAKAQEYDRK